MVKTDVERMPLVNSRRRSATFLSDMKPFYARRAERQHPGEAVTVPAAPA